MSVDALKRAFEDNLLYVQGKHPDSATYHDLYKAGAYTVRDRLWGRWIKSAQTYKKQQVRTVCFFSAEYLLGPHLANNMINLGIYEKASQAADEIGLNLDELLDQEEEPGLGNGGLGRLAACYLDSMATLQIPSIGYGIRYEHGIFDQEIHDGWQVEISDLWLRNGNPWELARPKLQFPVRYGGYTEHYSDADGASRVRWIPDMEVMGVAYDTPILGFGVTNTNLLRLWQSQASESFDFQAFNQGDYYAAVEAKVAAENISKVLYPNDEATAGKELRLKQQYFFVSCSLQDMVRLHLQQNDGLRGFHKKFVAQLNDTHPAVAIPELMRLFIDEHGLEWTQAWEITRNTFAYTNHTLLPEALETWPLDLFGCLLPRHLEIIYEINSHFLDEVRMNFPWDYERINRMSLISENGERSVRMANLATVGSFAVNGVAEMHSELVKSTILKDFYDCAPEKFFNVTNGVTPRRFVQLSNPGLCQILTGLAGQGWARDLQNLRVLEQHVDDHGFQQQWREMKRTARLHLTGLIKQQTGVIVDPDSMFDIQVKRIHEYKRQHLNLLHILTLYNRLKHCGAPEMAPRTFIFGGKAAPGYYMAKLIIKLINAVGDIINNDRQVNGLMRVVFFPNFNVKSAQSIYPAADLSEQLSTAGKEASGTGNMKFSMNGALTIGTMDGSNVEIREEVGAENFFLFGLNADEVMERRAQGYNPRAIYLEHDELREALDLINSGLFSHGDRDLFKPLTDQLINHDPYLLFADYASYIDCQAEVEQAWRDQDHWNHMSILNVARMGKFSSDRSIHDYCEKIWNV
ncbi:MAG: glycogen/starch/alpha-glucan phosphorylase, partial [Pseudomonadota bacterium]